MTRTVVPADDLIRRTRIQRGYSQYQFASRLADVSGNMSLTREDVARWERGKRIPGPYWRGWISRMLQLEPSELEMAARAARDVRRAERDVGAPRGEVMRQRPESGDARPTG